MDVVYERCAGLDIHKRVVVACRVVAGQRETRKFGTMTGDLRALRDWLQTAGCTHVAMESTGAYWKPIVNLLEGSGLEVLVVNAAHIKAVPGRKTDMNDAQWIADLLRHGLLRGSFIPDRDQRELRELVRYRRSLIEERTREVNRLQKVLEGANIKLGAVATDVVGVSGRAMLAALIQGEASAAAMADLAHGRLKAKRAELIQALDGVMGAHQRFLLAQQLAHLDTLDQLLAQVSDEVARRMRPFEPALAALDAIPGIGRRGAEDLLAETGVDMTRFPTHRHLASWAGMCPGQDESAGKRRTGRTRHGNRALRATLVEAAHAAARTKRSYLAAQFHRLAARRGKKRAAVAVGHSILVIAYYLLRDGVTYEDLGPTYFDQIARDRIAARARRRLEALGFEVTIKAAA
jgi:transposase